MSSVDSIKNTFTVALGVCFVSSILVSATVVALKPLEAANKKIDRIQNILIAGDLYEKDADVQEIYKERIRPQVVDLSSGEFIPEDKLAEEEKPANFNIKRIAGNPEFSKTIPADEDIADIKRQPKHMVVYEVMDGEKLEKMIMPIYGKGLWSTMYGFIALENDFQTVAGFTFYEHGETPGLGGEVDNPRWKAQWAGKKAYDENGNVLIEVLKGQVDPTNAKAKSQIDGLSGATITTRGVNNTVNFWLGENGYAPMLAKLREEAGNEQ